MEWATRQKEIVEFSVPLTIANLQRELLDFVNFKDLKFTSDVLREGYITKIKLNPRDDKIIFELALIPLDISDITSCDIIESGSNTDTITEDVTNTDTITEPGDC